MSGRARTENIDLTVFKSFSDFHQVHFSISFNKSFQKQVTRKRFKRKFLTEFSPLISYLKCLQFVSLGNKGALFSAQNAW